MWIRKKTDQILIFIYTTYLNWKDRWELYMSNSKTKKNNTRIGCVSKSRNIDTMLILK